MKTTTGGDARTRGRKVFFFLLAVVGALVITTVGSARVDSGGAADVAALAAFTPSSQVQFTLSACRLPDANNDGLPDYTLPTANGFVCNDADYTTGNLGKNWNELDLVPHRLQMSVGNQASATTDFNVIIAADHKTGVRTGYDIVSVPVINVGKSDASCTVSADAQSTIGGVTGGADEVMYRTLTVHLAKGKTCVIDYVQRLALGAIRARRSSRTCSRVTTSRPAKRPSRFPSTRSLLRSSART